jgi:hypothetical protein
MIAAVRRTKAGALTERVARLLLGAPSGIDSEKGQLRFNENISVNIRTGKFYDFDDETSGGHIELIQRVKNLQNGQAEAWLKANITDAKPLPLPAESANERALIGMLAAQPQLMAAIEEEVTVDHFGEIVHKQFFTAIRQAEQEPREDQLIAGGPVSMKTLMDSAGGDPLLPVQDRTLAAYVAQIIAEAPMPPDAAHFARTLAAQIRSAANREGDVDDEQDIEPEPAPFVPTMGLRMWADQDRPGRRYEYIIDDLIPERQVVVLMGDTGTGKSFLGFSMAMSLCRAVPFFGRRVHHPLGVIWCAYEAAEGADARMRAYRKHHGLVLEHLPMGALQRPVPLWPSEPNGDLLIREIQGITRAEFRGVPLGAIVVDTHNAGTPGASEIDSETVSRIRSYYRRAVEETGATLIIIGHTNSAGKHRGSELLTNNVDTIIKVSMKTRIVDREVIQLKDDDGRELRTWKVLKQREGKSGTEFDFVLRAVADGTKNQYGDDRTSCVVVQSDGGSVGSVVPFKGPRLTHERTVILQALRTAIEDYGEPAPAVLQLPRSIPRVVNAMRWKEVYLTKAPDPGAAPNTINKRLRDASNQFQNLKLIGRENPYVWLTGKEVKEDLFASAPQAEFPEDIR